MKTEYSTLKTVSSKALKEQNVVSVPLNLEKEKADKLMSVSGNVNLIDCRVNKGELIYSGRITHNVLYLADEIERVESGMEFTFKVSGDFSEDDGCKVNLSVGDCELKYNGNAVYIESLVTAEIEVFCENEVKYLKGTDTLSKNCQREYLVRKTQVVGFDLDDEFDTAKIYKVLCSDATVKLKSVAHSGGVAVLDGDVNLSIWVLHYNQRSDIIKETRSIPFRFEVETDAFAKETCNCEVKVEKLNLKVYIDEERDRSIVESDIKLNATTDYYVSEDLDFIDDVYSPCCELEAVKTPITFKRLEEQVLSMKRISGKLTAEIPENSRFVATVSDRAEIIDVSYEGGLVNVEALLSMDAIMVDGEQNTVSIPCRSPLSFSFENVDEIREVRLKLLTCNYKFRSGNIEFDGEVELEYCVYKDETLSLISDVAEGDEKKADKSVISVYVAEKGETEWDVTKALGVSIDDIYELNPQLQFPLEKNEKIICFRQIKQV
ncbi:MAG: SPOCS domain-containing protein [Christensenellaceae bacterium]